ncbi:YjaG family protein [Endozoicomonas sp. Mp262]|uniref:YjaG family protein n=1 Tax=Endozoicomonas sp. Mp262 TaxID=2919499 RepID=UPI0021DF939B
MNTRRQYALFIQQINTLSPWKLCAITTAIAEQSWPNFALFAELSGFGEPGEVRHCLNMLWDHVAGQQSAKNFERLIERIENSTPDPKNFDMYGVQPALDTMVGINCALHCAMVPSEEEAASAMTLSLNTIGKFIKYSEEPGLKGTELNQYIEQHPLYLTQMDFIDELMEILKTQKQPSNKAMKMIKQFAKNDGCSQLGIGV